MNANKIAPRIVGVLFIIGTVAGILSLVFAASTLDDPDYLVKISENENQMVLVPYPEGVIQAVICSVFHSNRFPRL